MKKFLVAAALVFGATAAFADPARLRFALDQQMVAADTALAGHEELAIFPPVTGG